LFFSIFKGGEETMDKVKLIQMLQKHKEFITQERNWDNYADINSLPSSLFLKEKFKSWINLKKELGIPIVGRLYNEEKLIEIARNNKEHMTSRKLWSDYSKNTDLPSSSTYMRYFGSWSKVKTIAGFSNPRHKKKSYSTSEIYKILKEHSANFRSQKQWDDYAKVHALPTFVTIRKHFDYEEILKIANKKKKINLTKDDLTEIVREHLVFLSSSMKLWDLYASQHKLPCSYTFVRKFGGWRIAKQEINKRLSQDDNETKG
jgi:hypothetical protein